MIYLVVQWKQKKCPFPDDAIRYYATIFNLDELTVKMLLHGGITDDYMIGDYIYPGMSRLHNPYLLNDMKKSVIRILKAIQNDERILIFGDYDGDGITSSSILYRCLKFFKATVNVKIPQRKEGYGLSVPTIEQASEKDFSLVITVDNGTSAHEAIALAKRKGIDVIVTDHHTILSQHPNCYAFINPTRSDSRYPFDKLSGAGVAFKLVHALFLAKKLDWKSLLWDYLELAALGTVADVVPLVGENRVIAKLGIRKMNTHPAPFFLHLKNVLRISEFESSDIAFSIAPILNAVGRINSPIKAVKTVVSNQVDERHIRALMQINETRKEMLYQQFQIADQKIIEKSLQERNVIVVCDEFHEGLIGLIASRISEKHHKPSIVITTDGGKGSCRSVANSEFSIINTINRCSQFLKSYGGHQAAAGLTIPLENLADFEREIQISAKQEPQIQPIKLYDRRLHINAFPRSLYDDFDLMEPFGNGNPKPIFYCQKAAIKHFEVFGKHKEHIKIRSYKNEALIFKKSHQLHDIENNSHLDFLYTFGSIRKRDFLINDFRGSNSL